METTLTKTVEQELLGAVGDPGGLEAIFEKHKGSKGPFYSGLALATGALTERFKTLSEKVVKADQALHGRQEALKGAEAELTRLELLRQEKAKALAVLDAGVKEKQELLARAKALAGLNFTLDELTKLHQLLAKLAASQGEKAGKVTSLFFDQVGQYQDIVSLELEAERAGVTAGKAKAEGEKWQAEAKAAEAKAKARKVSIDITEKLLALGVKEGDIPQWSRILGKAGVGPETLAQVLEHYASLQTLILEGEKRAHELKSRAASLDSQVKSLKQEQEATQAAIQTVRDDALAAVQVVSEQTLARVQEIGQAAQAGVKEVDGKVQEYGALREQVGDMRAEVALARALRQNDPEHWRTVSPQAMVLLIDAVLSWAWVNDFDPQLEPPASVQQAASNISSWNRVYFSLLLRWAATGLVASEHKAPGKVPDWRPTGRLSLGPESRSG